jgi:quercetin dioxygenase-like cupin family protein
MTMRKMKLKLVLAGVVVACAIGGFAMRSAWATPGLGVIRTILTGPVLLEDVDLKSESNVNEVEIQMKGFTDLYIVHYRIPPGGHSGWHSHPGACMVSVKSGTATEYRDDEPDTPYDYPAGTGFVENAGHAHFVANEGDTDLELVVIHLVPFDAPLRIDEPAP